MSDDLSPELDLLECCSAEDISLLAALRVFSSNDPHSTSNVQRVRRVITIYVQEGYLTVKQRTAAAERALPAWEVRQVLERPDIWAEPPPGGPEYALSLTPAGWNAFVDGSRDFFDRLFGG